MSPILINLMYKLGNEDNVALTLVSLFGLLKVNKLFYTILYWKIICLFNYI